MTRPSDPAKAMIRQRVRAWRESLAVELAAEWSVRAVERLLVLPVVAGAGGVFVYVSVGGEVRTRGLIDRLLGEGRKVAVPVVTGDGVMEARRMRSGEELLPGRFGVPAPAGDAPPMGPGEGSWVAVVPGVAFTSEGKRLGMGGGFYDRWLGGHPGVPSVGLAFEGQMVDELPESPTDRRVRWIVTESRVIDCVRGDG